MHLVQILLPLYRTDGAPQPRALFAAVRDELVERFGGLTAYNRAPAHGVWSEEPGRVEHDEIVVYEVMVETLDRSWWAGYRAGLEQRFAQEELVIRSQQVERL